MGVRLVWGGGGGVLGGYLQKAPFMAFLFSGRFSSTCSTRPCTGITRRVSKLRRCGSAAPDAIVRVNSQNAVGRGRMGEGGGSGDGEVLGGRENGICWDGLGRDGSHRAGSGMQRESGESWEGLGSIGSCREGTLGHRNALRWD